MIKKNIYYLLFLTISTSMEKEKTNTGKELGNKINKSKENRKKILEKLEKYNSRLCNIEEFLTDMIDNKPQLQDKNLKMEYEEFRKLVSYFKIINTFLIETQQIVNDCKDKKEECVLLNKKIDLNNYMKENFPDFFKNFDKNLKIIYEKLTLIEEFASNNSKLDSTCIQGLSLEEKKLLMLNHIIDTERLNYYINGIKQKIITENFQEINYLSMLPNIVMNLDLTHLFTEKKI